MSRGFISRRYYEYIESNRQYAVVSVMFVLLTIGGRPDGLVLVFAATPRQMALRSVPCSSV